MKHYWGSDSKQYCFLFKFQSCERFVLPDSRGGCLLQMCVFKDIWKLFHLLIQSFLVFGWWSSATNRDTSTLTLSSSIILHCFCQSAVVGVCTEGSELFLKGSATGNIPNDSKQHKFCSESQYTVNHQVDSLEAFLDAKWNVKVSVAVHIVSPLGRAVWGLFPTQCTLIFKGGNWSGIRRLHVCCSAMILRIEFRSGTCFYFKVKGSCWRLKAAFVITFDSKANDVIQRPK